MSKWDKDYINLCKQILKEEFPALTTKQLFFRQAILEMLWIYQVESNDVRWLQKRDVHIWDEWEIDENGLWKANQLVPNKDGKLEKKEVIKQFDKKYAHTIGTAYGYINNKFQNTNRLIETIKNNPNNRRMLMSLWQDDYIKTAVLPSCVWSSEWDVTDGYLNCWVHQRSCDVPLGLPFNVTQYATLLSLIAHCTDLKPGNMYWSIKDAHIYVNQIDGIKEQINRFDTLEDLKAPELWINPNVKDFFQIDNSKELKDIKVKNYKHHGKIKFPIAQ